MDVKLRAIKKELRAAVRARGSHLMDLFGVGPAGAGRILADVGDATRFPDRNHLASWSGTAPLEASSGDQIRHRLSRPGNRRMNQVLHVAAIGQIRHDTERRAYYRRKLAESKTQMEALCCLKRRLSDAVYRQLVTDAQAAEMSSAATLETGPGGHSGASSQSSATDLSTPVIGSSDQPLSRTREPDATRDHTCFEPPRGLDSQPSAPTRRSRQGAAPPPDERPCRRQAPTHT